MPTITVSYRREDTEALTGRVFDRLESHYGRGNVFRDVDSMSPGTDFREQINTAISNTNILVVMVGSRWLGPLRGHRSRIQDEIDPVRVEVETALRLGVSVIPVLVGNTKMPAASLLPESIKEFVFLHSVRMDPGQDFEHHCVRLIREMDKRLGIGRPQVAEVEFDDQLTSLRSENADSLHPRLDARTVGTAKSEWGGYARESVMHYVGSFLVIRPTFKRVGNVYSYVTDIGWDEREGGLVFQERERLDARYSHRGCVWIPSPSVHLHLVSGTKGWLRATTLSFLDDTDTMRGLMLTLHNVTGATYVPVSVPIVYIKRTRFDQERLGEITPTDGHHERYLSYLRAALNDGYLQMIVP